ncbi:unnamed protein product [Sphenostylis stenocarpa]|uniref:Cation/H(+) antiporter central domain-containing protein n=1 Tax=Sphenostylis stenocarpa TaxID=92480 RepID=A0AA86S984_9FABA|nr:unnamed protein product [Sphenostylis stenocarpa]
MRTLLNSLVTNVEIKHPVAGLVSLVDECEWESKSEIESNFVEKLCDMLFRVCADNKMFREAIGVFEYVMAKGLVIDGRSCFMLLLALKRCNDVEFCVRFFRQMVESGRVNIGVQSLTLVVDVLSRRGQVERAKKLMEEMAEKGIVRPTVFTYNTLLNACVVRKDRRGVDEILGLMESEGVQPCLTTYTILIEGYGNSGRIGEAEKVFEEMGERNVEMDVYTRLTPPAGQTMVCQFHKGRWLIHDDFVLEAQPIIRAWKLLQCTNILVLGNIYKPQKERWLIHDDTSGTVATYETIHQDIYNVTEEKRASLILLPFHKELNSEGVLETANNAFGDINKNVLQEPPCSVGILVNRGFRPLSKTTMNIIMVFIRGPDDRKALSIAWRIDRITVKRRAEGILGDNTVFYYGSTA